MRRSLTVSMLTRHDGGDDRTLLLARTKVESITSRRSEDHDKRDGVLEQIRSKGSSERICRDPKLGPRKNALPTTLSDNPRGTDQNSHHIAKSTDCDEKVESLDLFAVAEHVEKEEVGNG